MILAILMIIVGIVGLVTGTNEVNGWIIGLSGTVLFFAGTRFMRHLMLEDRDDR